MKRSPGDFGTKLFFSLPVVNSPIFYSQGIPGKYSLLIDDVRNSLSPAELVNGDLPLPSLHLLPEVQLNVLSLHLLLQDVELLLCDSTPGGEIKEGHEVWAGVDKAGGAAQRQLPSVSSLKCLQSLETVHFL